MCDVYQGFKPQLPFAFTLPKTPVKLPAYRPITLSFWIVVWNPAGETEHSGHQDTEKAVPRQ